jgi:hypothetical protein
MINKQQTTKGTTMKQSLLQITDIACPNCHAIEGEWCQRHGQVLGGALLACALRSREVIRLNNIINNEGDN